MTDLRRLRDLDERLVPAAAARVRAWADALEGRRERLVTWAKGLRLGLDARSLRQLDERYATRGPLGLLREVPQVGFVVIGLVFLAGTGTAVSRDAANNRLAQQQTVSDPSAGPTLPGEDVGNRTLGPAVGDTVQGYQAMATQDLVTAQKSSGDRVALVSLRSYLSPAQMVALFTGESVVRIYLRSRSGGKDAAQLPVDVSGNLQGTLTKAYAQAARGRLAAQKSYQGYVNTLTVATKEDQSFKDLYASFARSTGAEAKDYQHACACGYAAVVVASPATLARLASAAAVRAVQAAPKGLALKDLEVLPLLPEVTGVVPQAQAQVDPP